MKQRIEHGADLTIFALISVGIGIGATIYVATYTVQRLWKIICSWRRTDA
jgi:ABC-type phosphate transport system permease subunit